MTVPLQPRRLRARTAADEMADQIAQLRAVAENPLVRPSIRIEARLALKALVPPPQRVAGSGP